MDDEDSYESRKQVAVSLMRKHLPAYAVKCLVAAGFDSFEAIEQMTVNKRRGEGTDSLDDIESYINHAYPKNSSYWDSDSSACMFPPGHRLLLASLVKEVKQLSSERLHSKRKREPCSQQNKGVKSHDLMISLRMTCQGIQWRIHTETLGDK